MNLGKFTREELLLALAVAAAVWVALEFLFHVHFGSFGAGLWGAAVLLAALTVAVLLAALTVLASQIRDAQRRVGASSM